MLQVPSFCELSPTQGWALVTQLSLSHFCLCCKQPLINTPVGNPNKNWFAKLDFGGIRTFICHGSPSGMSREVCLSPQEHNSQVAGRQRWIHMISYTSQAWWPMALITGFRRQRQEDLCEFVAYIGSSRSERHCFKKQKQNNNPYTGIAARETGGL